MEPKRRRTRGRGAAGVMLVLACALAAISCSGERDEPISPNTPPRPTTGHSAQLMHAHFHLPARPQPPLPGMM